MDCIRCKKSIPDDSLYCPYCGKKQTNAPPAQRKHTRRPKGTGSVYKLSGNRSRPWAAVNGRLIGTFATSSEATLALDDFNAKNINIDLTKYTLEQVHEAFLDSPRHKKLSKDGVAGLAAAWKHLYCLHQRNALSIKITEFQGAIDSATQFPRYKELTSEQYAKLPLSQKKRYDRLKTQKPKPLGYDGKNRIKQLVSHLYSEMMRLGMMDASEKNPAELLVLPPIPKTEKRNFTPEEKQKLKNMDSMESVKILLIYLESGMRLGELLKMPKANVDLINRQMVGGSKTSAGKNRTIPITEDALPYVEYFYNKSNTYLIEKNGKPLRLEYYREKMYYPALKACGIEWMENGKNVLTPHRTRHTFIASAVQGGVAPEALKEIVGHSKYSTTVDKYATELDPEYLRNELKKKA